VRGLQVGDGGVDAEGEAAAAVGGDGEGEVGQGEQRAAVDDVGGVEVLVGDGHLHLGPARSGVEQLDPVVAGETVVVEEGAELGIHAAVTNRRRESRARRQTASAKTGAGDVACVRLRSLGTTDGLRQWA